MMDLNAYARPMMPSLIALGLGKNESSVQSLTTVKGIGVQYM